MMDFRTRLEQSKSRPVSDAPAVELSSDIEAHFSCPYFAVERGNFPSCLELRFKDGARKALPYAFVTELAYDPDRGIAILTSAKRITITGRNLARLFDYLVTYRVRYVQANLGNDGGEDGLFVGEIVMTGLDG